MRFYVVMLFACLLLQACATNPPSLYVRSIVLPDGEDGFSIRCDNENINACYERAGDVCNHGYEIQQETKENGFVASSGTYVDPGLGFSASRSASTSEKGLIIKCKNPVQTKKEQKFEKQAALQERQEIEKSTRAVAVGFIAAFSILLVSLYAVTE